MSSTYPDLRCSQNSAPSHASSYQRIRSAFAVQDLFSNFRKFRRFTGNVSTNSIPKGQAFSEIRSNPIETAFPRLSLC